MNGDDRQETNAFFLITGKKKSHGFTLLAVLFMITVFSISLMGAARCYRTTLKRENEQELLFRGDQILKGIQSYYLASGKGTEGDFPPSLETLLKDPRSMTVKRHLRRLYRDPMTQDGEWGLVRDKSGRIKGVFSHGKEKPMKISGFPKAYSRFEAAQTYAEWRFVYDQEPMDK